MRENQVTVVIVDTDSLKLTLDIVHVASTDMDSVAISDCDHYLCLPLFDLVKGTSRRAGCKVVLVNNSPLLHPGGSGSLTSHCLPQ